MTQFGCTGCHRCDEVCPEILEPSRLIALIALSTTPTGISSTQAERLDDLRTEQLQRCTDCGECTRICPSALPLDTLLSQGKVLLENEEAEKQSSDYWKQRFTKRQRRFDTLKVEKTLKARATLAQDNQQSRDQAQRPPALPTPTQSQTLTADRVQEAVAAADFSRESAQSDIAAAVARVKAKRAAQKKVTKRESQHDA